MSTPPDNLSIAALSRDVFFGMRIRTVLRNLGYNMVLCKNESELVERAATASLVLVDFNMPVAWDEIEVVLKGSVPVIAFGAHTNVEGFKTAKSSGATRVISNGEFTRKLPNLLAQYLKS